MIREDDYFPGLVKAHLDRGAKLLEDEKRYSKDFYNIWVMIQPCFLTKESKHLTFILSKGII